MPSGPITKHFTWEEARCRCGCEIPTELIPQIRATAQWAEEVRAELGSIAMRPLSWYRCASYNRQVGGARRSQHLRGRAIDFVLKDRTARAVQKQIISRGLYPPGLIRGFGRYPGFTHIDRRQAAPASWGS